MSQVQDLMNTIAHFDCEPSVFTVDVQNGDHFVGFHAFLSFRGSHEGRLSGLDARGDTPEVALQILWDNLRTHFGRCLV